MIMLEAALAAMKLAGSHLPAFKALFDAVKETLVEADQDTLKVEYERQMKRSDDLHRRLQDL